MVVGRLDLMDWGKGVKDGEEEGGARAHAVKIQSFPLNTAFQVHPHVHDALLTNQTDSELFSYIH